MAFCRRFISFFALLALAAIFTVFASPKTFAQSMSSGGVVGQSQSQSCQIVADNINDRLEDIEAMITSIQACHNNNMLYDGTGCVPPAVNNHSWAQTQVTFYDQADAASAIYDLKGPTGPAGADATTCPSGTCVCPNGNCEQASCYNDSGGGNNCCAIHGERWRRCGKDSCCHDLYSSKYTPSCSVGGPAVHCCPPNTTWTPEAGGWGSACKDKFGDIKWYDCD